MNVGLIIAGGSGNRMGQDIPKQFMHVDGAPIIIMTMQAFERHPDIDAIAVVCLKGWETVLQSYTNQFSIKKLKWIFPGGDTGMASIHNGIYGLKEAGCDDEDLVLIHDSVRPLLSQEIISSNIAICKRLIKNCPECLQSQGFSVVRRFLRVRTALLPQQVSLVIGSSVLRHHKLFVWVISSKHMKRRKRKVSPTR